MSKGPWDFKVRIMERMVNAVQAVGLPVARAEYEDGKYVVVIGKPTDAAATGNTENEWDGVLENGKDKVEISQ